MDNRPLHASLRCLTHGITLLSIALLLLNDHLLKLVAPSFLTGKLSDFAGLFFFPFLLAALLSLLLWPWRCNRPRWVGVLAVAITAVTFVLVKVTFWGHAWAIHGLSSVLGHPITIARDPTDLIALVMLWPAWWLWQRMAGLAPLPGRAVRIGWLALALAAGASVASTPPSPPLPPIVMFVIGHLDSLAPGSEASLQLLVRNRTTNETVPNARVTVNLGTPGSTGQQTFTGQTDENGMLTVRFPVPEQVDQPDQILRVVADTSEGSAQFQAGVYVGQVFNVLVSTDKPVYQPGQVIHMRTVALDNMALKAASQQPLVLTVWPVPTSPWIARPPAATT
jgi:hypothetical protein